MALEDLATVDMLRKFLSYDPDTGVFVWNLRKPEDFVRAKHPSRYCKIWNTRYGGKVAGSFRGDGYGRISVDDKRYLAHRVAWAMERGTWPAQQLDHINGNPSDNRLVNLREVANADNAKNARRAINNTSGVTGVTRHSLCDKWVAQIHANGKAIYLGIFENFEDAVAARAAAEVKYGFHPNHGRAPLV